MLHFKLVGNTRARSFFQGKTIFTVNFQICLVHCSLFFHSSSPLPFYYFFFQLHFYFYYFFPTLGHLKFFSLYPEFFLKVLILIANLIERDFFIQEISTHFFYFFFFSIFSGFFFFKDF